MGPGWWQILVVLVLVVLLFGRGRIADLMGDVAKVIKSFQSGLADEGEETAVGRAIEHERPPPQPKARTARKQKLS